MEELRKYLEEKKKECRDALEAQNDCIKNEKYWFKVQDSLMTCHKLASKLQAYNEIIDYIDNVKNK